jgi:AsmA protein
MKRFLKWFLIVGAAAGVLLVSAILLIPLFFDAEDFKPQLQSMLSDAAGRPVRLEGDIALSIFPWTGFSIGGFQVMNPPGFSDPHFLTVDSFEIKVAPIPLFSRDIQVRHVRLASPRLVLETTSEGRSNWENLGRSPDKQPADAPPPPPSTGDSGLPVKAFRVNEISVTDGEAVWIDRGSRKTLSDLELKLENISLTSPIQLAFSARLEGDPFSLNGTVGPVGKPPGAAPLPMDLTAAAFDVLTVHLQGKIDNPTSEPAFQGSVRVEPFSPKALAQRVGPSIETADPDALERLSLTAEVKGTPQAVTLSDGQLKLDETNLDFSLAVKAFNRPDIRFDARLDQLDVDRYLPPPGAGGGEEETATPASTAPSDRSALRSLLLTGNAEVGRLRVSGGELRDIHLKVTAKDGVFTVDPLDLTLYGGTLRAAATADLRQKAPRSRIEATLEGIDMGPLLTDFAGTDVLTGTGGGSLSLNTAGETPDAIKRHLGGSGDLLFTDGAIKGVDLTRIAQNAKRLLTLEEPPALEGRTDFSEFKAGFIIDSGVVRLSQARLIAPLMRLNAEGSADLTAETLDLRAEPRLVASLKGKGDEKKRAGFEIPLLITGAFDDPKIRPDPAALIRQIEDLPASIDKGKEEIEKQLEEKKAAAKKLIEEKKGQLDSILGGQKPSSGKDDDKKSGSGEGGGSDILKKLPFGQ